MAKSYKIFIWKKAPFLRVLVPVILGIIAGYYLKLNIHVIIILSIILIASFIILNTLPLAYRFKLQALNGIIVTAFIINAGSFLVWNKDIRNHSNWYGNHYSSSSYIVATISEPPVEKNKSYKALVNVDAVINHDSIYKTTGKLLLYFAKDSGVNNIAYGNRVLFKKNLKQIKNSGNPAAFNYARYCAFQQIFQQCYLKQNDWILLKEKNINPYKKIIFTTRNFIIGIINKYIPDNDESSVAKALVIGYKVDLDKDMVQAYSNAGLVHLIVIAGLHLGLIYSLLLWLTARISFFKRSQKLRLGFILCCLWFFALLTGASPPVMRAVVMFSFIAVGKILGKNSSVYNSLAASAFLLLCYDPFSLWDAGFQLSYLAVTGIVITQRYIYNRLYLQNKLLREAWKIASVSLAAQVFILPASLYYFHQIPLLFVPSNIIAIPLAIVILYGCVFLVFFSWFHFLAFYVGKILGALIWLLNHTVLYINSLPFALWTGFSFSVAEIILLYIIIICFLFWLIKRNMFAFKAGIAIAFLFTIFITTNKWNFFKQKKIIVYDVPSYRAIDFIKGDVYHFIGDSDLMEDGLLQNFHLKPARIFYSLHKKMDDEFSLFHENNFYQFGDKKIMLIDSAIDYKTSGEKINVDYIVISKNPKLFIPNLAAVFNCGLYIFDASNPLWKIEKWKKDCEDLHLRFHSVPEQGAFVTDL